MIIGLIDSGIGGWSFLTQIKKSFPNHTYLYYADQKNCPYGNKSVEELNEIANHWIQVFKEQKLDALVIACNTLTAWFRDRFREELNIPVLGTTDGLVNEHFQDLKTVLLATVQTIQSEWYQKLFANIQGTVGNKWLAASIEKDFILSEKEMSKLKKEIEDEVGFDWDALLLGCTHYPLVKKQLREIWPNKTFIDPAESIVIKMKDILDSRFSINNNIIMYTTGSVEVFKKQIESYFTSEIYKQIKVRKVECLKMNILEKGH